MNFLSTWQTLPVRIYLALMFLSAGWIKVSFGLAPPEWFAGLDFPAIIAWLPASVNWFLAGYGEIFFGLLLLTPFYSFGAAGLLFIIYVAVYTSHWDLGWMGWDDPEDGFKIPLIYAVMALGLVMSGIVEQVQRVLAVFRKQRTYFF